MTDVVDLFGQPVRQRPAPSKKEITYHPTWGGYNNLPKVPGYAWKDYWPRVSTLAKVLDETSGLTTWKLRKVVQGIAELPVLLDLISERHAPDSKDGKAQFDFVVGKALETARTHEGADTGTRLHELCELADLDGLTEVPGISPFESATVSAYRRVMAASDYEILPEYMERVLICPELEVAGRTDRIVRHKPTGRLVIADLKSQKWEPGAYDGLALSIQLAAYANAAYMLNTDDWTWIPAPEIDKTQGLIIWIPAVQPGRCELFTVDLAFGYQAAQGAKRIKEWRNRKGVVGKIS